jgi:phosphatidylglycerophosphate synthase
MGTVRFGLTGLAAQAVLLGLLAATVGLSAGGWAVGLAIVVATEALLGYALRRTHAATIGAANVVTFIRAALVATVAALVTDGETGPLQLRTTLTVTAIALALDAVDGQVARRTGSTSRVGSRFDGEVDALLILVLSVAVSHTAGWWVLAIGAWRYAFGAAGWVLPWLRRPLPPSRWGKTVAAVQGIMLAVALSGLLPHAVMVTALVGALILLSESFCHDVWWLWTQRPSARAQAPVARWRRITGAVVTTLAVAVMWGALVLPDHRSDLTLTSLLRVPIDGIVIVAVALMLPSRARWFLAFVSGGALATLTLARVLDVGFFYVLDRPFSPVTDWTSLDRAIRVLSRSIGHNKALLLTVVVIAVAALVLPAIALATARVTGAAARHPRASTKVIAGLAAVWTLCAALGVTTATGVPVASRSAAEAFGAKVRLVRADLRDQHEFNARLAAADAFGGAPAADLLPALRGKDVLLVFIESYGRVAVMGSAFAPHIDDLLRAGTARLHAAGYSSRSAYLESPTFGAGSWLAHSTLESGLWINNNGRYDELLASSRFTLSQAFKRAGWRTVFDLPATEVAWPDGQRFYRFDAMYGADNVGYKGPSFGFATIPDQYTLHALNQRELRTPDRPPLFAEVVLDSSHAPWTPLPHMVARRDLGHGRIFGPMARGQLPSTAIWSDSNRAKAAYAQSIDYTLSALISFLEQSRDKNLVVIALGDHQPYTIITGDQASHDVPITILARDRGVIDRISSWGWQGGLLPNPDAPVWRMDAFRDRFLAAYGPSPAPAVQARGSTP